MGTHGIGWAVKQLNGGYRVRRDSWNSKGMSLGLWAGYPTSGVRIDDHDAQATGEVGGSVCKFQPYVMMRTAEGDFVPWVCSHSDLLADDWEIAA